ncbi:hypothetical protein Trydic_g23432 [Trypoxylus dichotomus]
MEQMCRTCLKYHSINVNIFQHSQDNKYIPDLIRELTSIEIQQIEGFPVHICCNCLEKLNVVLKFKEMVTESDNRLHSLLQSVVDKKDVDFLITTEATICVKEESCCQETLLNDPLCISDVNSLPPVETVKEENISEVMLETDSLLNYDFNNSSIGCVDKEEIENRDFIQIEKQDDDMEQDRCIKDNKGAMQIGEIETNFNGKHVNQNDLSKIKSNSKVRKLKKNISIVKKPSLSEKKKVRLKYNNEAQLKLLNNPDYLRVKGMKLTAKERDRATVHCQECNRSFNFRYYVAVHAHFHTGNLPYQCDKCDARFPKLSGLNQHKQVHTKGFTCDVCGRKFSLKATLQMHKRTHSEEMHYKCDVCGKKFRCPPVLRTHMSVHSKERKFVCEICGKGFVDKARLQRHKKTHVTDKKFVCTVCEKSFKTKHAHGQHLKRHSDDKPYTCDYCGKLFKNKDTLRIHVWIHTGEKKFACEICRRTFTQKACLTRHMRVHTGETPYPCKLCPTNFKYSHDLLQHMKKVHESGKDDLTTQETKYNQRGLTATEFLRNLIRRQKEARKSSMYTSKI